MSVLILGATSRIAQQLGHRYAERGHAVFVAARDSEEAARVAADVAIRRQVKTGSAPFDALDFDTHRALVDTVEEAVGPIEVAVVAFGEMGDQNAGQADFAAAKRVIDVNFTGAASLCEAIAEAMEPRASGAIIGITSVAGDRGRQSNYFYGSAKGAFTLYLQGLRNRLHKCGVQVMTVRLGFVDTRMTFGMETAIPIASPEAISAAIVRDQLGGADDVYHPRFWRGIMGVIRRIPESLFKRLSL
jgi:short-subunit dehydrogenase